MECHEDRGQKVSNPLSSAPDRIVFDAFRVEVRTGQLFEGDQRLAVPPKAVQLLALLILQRRRVVEKQELMEWLWPDRFVSEANLTQHVFTLRRALGELPESPRYIATAARQGYRFIGSLPGAELNAATDPVLSPVAISTPPVWMRAWGGRIGVMLLVALAIVGGMRMFRPARPEAVVNPEAYRLYEHGRYFWSHGYDDPASLESSRASFLRAIALEPRFARAHAGLAMTYGSMAVRHLEPPDRAFAAAKAAAVRAIELDEHVAEAHYALGSTAFRFDWNWRTAERELRRAIALDPAFAEAHQLYGDFLTDMRRYDEALQETSRAVELDPLWGVYLRSHARALAAAGRLEEAIGEYRRALDRDPTSYRLFLRLSELHERHGDYDEAVSLRARAEVLAVGHSEPGDLAGSPEDADELVKTFHERGFAAAMRELYARKLARLDEDERRGRYISPFTKSLLYARLGDRPRAIEALEQAAECRSTELVAWNTYPELTPLTSEKRVQRLLESVNIPFGVGPGD